MTRSFQLVDHKVAESDFFLCKILDCGYNIFELRCYLSAFAASARSITFSLQAVMRSEENFDSWYETYQNKFKECNLSKFFNNYRRISQHIGEYAYGGGYLNNGKTHHYFSPTKDLPDVPDEHISAACENYLRLLIQLVYDCYLKFGPKIDALQYFTEDNFKITNRTIEDAEEELGLPRGWTDIGDPKAAPYRWQALRDMTMGCEINHLFNKYLGKEVPCVERLPEYAVSCTTDDK